MMPRAVPGLIGVSALIILSSCQRQSGTGNDAGRTAAHATANLIDTQWTDAAAKRVEKLTREHKLQYAIPELRVYDSRGRLIHHVSALNRGKLGLTLDRAIAADRRVSGPSFARSVSDLETRDHRPAASVVQPAATITIFDYWANWCIPCKMLEKELIPWAERQPPGAVRIVRAEADLVKAQRERGELLARLKQASDRKAAKVEMK